MELTAGTVHRALREAGGDRDAAAKALGVERQAIVDAIGASKDLRTYWATHDREMDVPTHQDALTREKSDFEAPPVSEFELDRANAVMLQNARLMSVDWEGLGVRDTRTLQLMRQFEGEGVGRSVLRLMDTMQGGMAFCFARTSNQFDIVATAIEQEAAKDKPDDNRLFMLHQRFKDLADLMRMFSKEVGAAANIRLLIADRARRIQKASDKLRKPGWKRATPAPAIPTDDGTRN
jgi:hypothetical protein